jgi:hypothetical protein
MGRALGGHERARRNFPPRCTSSRPPVTLDLHAPNPRPITRIRDDGRSLVIHASGGVHEEPHSIAIDDSGDHVTVTLMVGDGDHVGLRIGIARIRWFELRLPKPLLDRFLRDGEEIYGA